MPKTGRIYQNLPLLIADGLREAILDGELNAGERLKQVDIANRYATSLIPVREALRTLEMEGLITSYPNKGYVVSSLSIQQIADIFNTRIILELGAFELSIPALTGADLLEAQDLIRQLDQTKSGKDLSQLNRKLHHTLYRKSDNQYLLSVIDSLHVNIERYMRIYLLDQHNNNLSQIYHRQIVESARNRDIATAKGFLKTHMELARNNLIEALRG